MSDQKLQVIIPYFNHTNACVNRRLLEESLVRLSHCRDCAVLLAEGIWNSEAELPDLSDRVHRHLKYHYPQALWVKENLINLALRDCDTEWEYAAWIDKDIEFLNSHWAVRTRDALKKYDIIQPWSRAVCSGESGSGPTISEYLDLYQGRLLHDAEGMMPWTACPQGEGGSEGHCGFAWAATRSFLDRIGGLYDRCLLGGGDDYLKASLKGERVPDEIPPESSPLDGDRRKELGVARFYGDFTGGFAERCRGARIGFVEGKIIHHYHGRLTSRGYLTRYDAAIENGFVASRDISYESDGTLRLRNESLEKAIREYFPSREEHLLP